MKKGLFTGWQDIFAFTFKQDTKGKYVKNTLTIAVILLAIGAAISLIMAAVQKKNEEEISPIHTVHIVNESSMQMLLTDQFALDRGSAYPDVDFVTEDKDVKTLAKELAEDPDDIILEITDTETGFLAKVVLPENSEVSEGDANDFLGDFSQVTEISKMISSGISMDKLVYAMSGVNVSSLDAGEDEKSLGEEMVGMMLPMIVCLLLYIMVMIYGLSMGNAASAEKTSKLMEMMLTMTKPYAMIFGKIFAMTVAAVLQMLSWVASLIVGFFAGHMIAKEVIFPEYSNVLIDTFKTMSEQGAGSAFSSGAFVLFVIEVCVAILFFCLLAATFGSFATKTEEVPQFMGYYQMLSVLGFMGAYIIPLQENPLLNTVMRIIPITAAYLLPGDILVGNVTLLQGALYTALLAAFTVGLVFVAGKVYFNQLFYRGENFFTRLGKKLKKTNE